MKKHIFFVLCFCVINLLIAQNTSFEYLNSDSPYLIATEAIETDNDNLIFSVFKIEDDVFKVDLLELSQTGTVINERSFENDSLPIKFFSIIKNNSEYIIVGNQYSEYNQLNYLWYVRLNDSFDIVEEFLYLTGNEEIRFLNSKLVNGKIYCAGNTNQYSPVIFILDDNGLLLESKTDFPFNEIVTRMEWNSEDSTYTLKGNYIITLDKSFNEINRINFGSIVSQQGDLKRFSDSTFLISGKHTVHDLQTFEQKGRVMGISEVNENFDTIRFDYVGWLGDTIHFPGFFKSIDYIDKNKIFYGGTSNMQIIPTPFGTLDSWFTLVQYDSLLNKRWEKSYGGDAYYNMFGLLATSDGGCVMYGFKHDYENNPNVLQLYILKVNENGDLITSTTVPIADIDFEVYPNPFAEQITVKIPEILSKKDGLAIKIHDIQGKVILQQKIYNNKFVVNLSSSLASGVYIVSLEMNNQVLIKKKIVKQ